MQLLTRDCSTNYNREKTVLELNEPNRYLAVIFVVYAIKDGLLNWQKWKTGSSVEQKHDHIWK